MTMAAKSLYEKFAYVYDSIMPDRFYEDYYGFIVEILERFEIRPIESLEVACGTGKLAKIFLDKGYAIEGLDLSESMLNIAKKKGLKVHQGNMIDFELNRKYDLILCIFDSLNYVQQQSELQQCFDSVNKHLDQDGLFIFDMNSDYKINKTIPRNFAKIQYYKIGDIELIWLNSSEPNTWIADMIFFEKAENGMYRRFCEKHIEKAYKLNIVKSTLKKSRFQIAASYADFEFSKIKKNSNRWFFVCRKK
jgi:SAM-dependent methyltransferase